MHSPVRISWRNYTEDPFACIIDSSGFVHSHTRYKCDVHAVFVSCRFVSFRFVVFAIKPTPPAKRVTRSIARVKGSGFVCGKNMHRIPRIACADCAVESVHVLCIPPPFNNNKPAHIHPFVVSRCHIIVRPVWASVFCQVHERTFDIQ